MPDDTRELVAPSEEMGALLPCPFCGGGALHGQTLDNGWYVMCVRDECFGMVGYLETSGEAVAAWNTRAAIAAMQPEGWVHEAVNALDWSKVYAAARKRTVSDACMEGYDFHLAREIADRIAAFASAAPIAASPTMSGKGIEG